MVLEPLWAITTYFDPLDCKNRLNAFREFRRRLKVPLLAVELGYAGSFHLSPHDAEILIQLKGEAVLWQKERLLNIALKALPEHCRAVAWLDCDVVFDRSDWPSQAMRLLDDFALLQPFSRLHYLYQNESPDARMGSKAVEVFDSIASRFAMEDPPVEIFRIAGSSRKGKYAPGMAWVARLELLQACDGLYDADIMGANDKLIIAAAFGRQEDAAYGAAMNARQWKHYEAWARCFQKLVNGRISYLDGDLFHLWHGAIAGRQYAERYEGFRQFNFEPEADIAHDRNGIWRWNSDKPGLHAHLRRYFATLEGRPALSDAAS